MHLVGYSASPQPPPEILHSQQMDKGQHYIITAKAQNGFGSSFPNAAAAPTIPSETAAISGFDSPYQKTLMHANEQSFLEPHAGTGSTTPDTDSFSLMFHSRRPSSVDSITAQVLARSKYDILCASLQAQAQTQLAMPTNVNTDASFSRYQLPTFPSPLLPLVEPKPAASPYQSSSFFVDPRGMNLTGTATVATPSSSSSSLSLLRANCGASHFCYNGGGTNDMSTDFNLCNNSTTPCDNSNKTSTLATSSADAIIVSSSMANLSSSSNNNNNMLLGVPLGLGYTESHESDATAALAADLYMNTFGASAFHQAHDQHNQHHDNSTLHQLHQQQFSQMQEQDISHQSTYYAPYMSPPYYSHSVPPVEHDFSFVSGCYDSAFDSSPAGSIKSLAPLDFSVSEDASSSAGLYAFQGSRELLRGPSPSRRTRSSRDSPKRIGSCDLTAQMEGLGGEKLVCPYANCGKTFLRYHNLKSHMIVHSDIKPFQCTQCNMAFRRNHDLRRHSRLHLGVKPFACPRCPKRFCRSDALQRHIRVDACGEFSEQLNFVRDGIYEGSCC